MPPARCVCGWILSTRLRLLDNMFEKTLTSLVRGLRSKKTNAQFVNKCLQELKTELRSQYPEVKAEAVRKLIVVCRAFCVLCVCIEVWAGVLGVVCGCMCVYVYVCLFLVRLVTLAHTRTHILISDWIRFVGFWQVLRMCCVWDQFDIMGYDLSWSHFHVIETMSHPWFGHKRFAYLVASLLFTEDTELNVLTTHLFRKVYCVFITFVCMMCVRCIFVCDIRRCNVAANMTDICVYMSAFVRT